MVYITGDLHGDISRLEDLKLKKKDTLIVCGDFGFIWDGSKSESKIIKKISRLSYTILFVDGTHENFELLKTYPIEEFKGSMARHIAPNVYQLLRGNIYEIEGKTFFAFGGGESIDKELRQTYNKYWEEELPSIDEMKTAVNNLNNMNRQVNYIITHEPPAKLKGLFNSKIDNINALNRYFDEVSENVNYDKWFFGSVHVDRKIPPKYVSLFTTTEKITTTY